MGRFECQLAAAQAVHDAQCDCCDHGPRERAPAMEREPYADKAREWAGVETRETRFVPSNWQEGDFA